MGLRIHSNVAALRVRNELERSGARIDRSLARLSSGERVSSAADDPSALGLGERRRARLGSIRQAKRNNEDSIGVQRFALSGLASLSGLLARMRALTLQSLSETMTPGDRILLNQDFQALKQEIDRVAEQKFNGLSVLADRSTITLQTGVDGNETLEVHGLDVRTEVLGLSVDSVMAPKPAEEALDHITRAFNIVLTYMGSRGALVGRLESNLATLAQEDVNLSASQSLLSDTDYASEIAHLTSQRIVRDSALAVLTQANAEPELAMQLLTSVTASLKTLQPDGGTEVEKPAPSSRAKKAEHAA